MRTNLLIYTLLLVFSFQGCKDTTPSCPLNHGDWEYIPHLSDEFNGTTIDRCKWYDFNPGWKGRKPGFFSPQNVKVENGELILTSKTETLDDLPEGYHTFTTAAVQSKSRMLYGYYEIRCKPMKSRCSSAFWFYAVDGDLWTEIDVFEICGKHPQKNYDKKYFATTHILKSPETGDTLKSDHVEWHSKNPLADNYLISALEWRKDSLIWYVNGEVIRKRENTKWHQPLTLNFDSETMPNWFGMPDPNDPKGEYKIDYIRVWRDKNLKMRYQF
ncbi:family 16 glycosylhydrolase [Halosquirtibacter xylanolyticus]|uniref:family 16 glycosylhydrolase n=1 Tax=Halosquirtibacter xylanolyticus TaxID=3374599 RepID=UPI0037482546|nr:family 16 glycosylhydrolase [Prolixibacteraceae bacterium]